MQRLPGRGTNSLRTRIRRYSGSERQHMVRSYDYLQNQDIIYNKRGIGYFVAGNAREKIIALRRESFLNESLPEMFRQMQLLDIPVSEISALYQQFLKENK